MNDLSFYQTRTNILDKNKLDLSSYYSSFKSENILEEEEKHITIDELAKVYILIYYLDTGV